MKCGHDGDALRVCAWCREVFCKKCSVGGEFYCSYRCAALQWEYAYPTERLSDD